MKKVQYELKSKPGEKVWVSEEYAKKVEELINLVLAAKVTSDLVSTIYGYPESLKLQDEIYLLACINWLENVKGEEKEEVDGLVLSLIQTVKALYN